MRYSEDEQGAQCGERNGDADVDVFETVVTPKKIASRLKQRENPDVEGGGVAKLLPARSATTVILRLCFGSQQMNSFTKTACK